MRASRSGALFSAFPYPTKISPEAIALFIATHTQPGDTVFDGFAGSGTTGLAALLCENPPQGLRDEAKRLGLKVKWGARNAVLYELGTLGAFVARTLTNPPDPKGFVRAAEDILRSAEKDDGWMYAAKDPDGKEGTIRYLVWSDLLCCPSCRRQVTLWNASVSLDPASISSQFTCPHCSYAASTDEVKRLTETVWDDLLREERQLRTRRVVRVCGATGKKNWSRAVTRDDIALLRRIAQESLPESVPHVAIPWGDLYRRGYHQGITYLHHFYTRRNLIVFGRLWERTAYYDDNLCDALRFWLLSYNASHSTIMTRVVAKSGQKDLVITSAQPGVLYVSGLPVEKNLFSGLRRKLSTIGKAFAMTHGCKGKIEVFQGSCTQVDLPDNSIDYVFTDPPFGGNIPYAEINFLNEAWLNRYTDRTDEIIVSIAQGKTITDYQELLTAALAEVHRILRRNGKATVVFHSASAEVWNTLQFAYQAAGLSVECASVLDKTQGSFKQVTTAGAVRGDPVLMLGKRIVEARQSGKSVWVVVEQLQREAAFAPDPAERTVQRLYSRLVSHYLAHHQQVPLDAGTFYRWFAEQDLPQAVSDASA
ncbi:MAG: DNA methylase N-4/N-6 [Chromatiales bacterium 21-64-14]|nr:MAG: DNA methylase N-4/N-6 [Chromatiales bacterium 21-64-14]